MEAKISASAGYAVSINFILYAILILLGGIRFQENDDVLMMLISNGAFGDNGAEYLVFSNFLIGHLISILNKMFGSLINGYTFYLIFVNVLASSSILYLLFHRFSLQRGVLYFGFFSFYFVFTTLFLQFTTTAFSIGLAGLIFLVEGCSDEKLRKRRIFLILGVIFLVLASAIRFEVFLLLLVLGLVVIVYSFIFKIHRIGRITFFFSFFIASFFSFLLNYVDKVYYLESDDGWQEYFYFNSLRGKLHDNPNFLLFKNACMLENAVWTKEQAFLFSTFNAPNLPSYHYTVLQVVKKCIDEKVVANQTSPKFLLSLIHRLWDSLLYGNRLILFTLLVAIIIGLENQDRFKFFLFYLFVFLILGFLISFDKTLKIRILIALLSFPIVISVFLYPKEPAKSFFTKIKYIIISIFFLLSIFFFYKKIINNKNQKEIAAPVLEFLSSSNEFFIIPGIFDGGVLALYDPFASNIEVKQFENIYTLGWLSQSPILLNVLKNNSLTSKNYFSPLAEGKAVLVLSVGNGEEAFLEVLEKEVSDYNSGKIEFLEDKRFNYHPSVFNLMGSEGVQLYRPVSYEKLGSF